MLALPGASAYPSRSWPGALSDLLPHCSPPWALLPQQVAWAGGASGCGNEESACERIAFVRVAENQLEFTPAR
jgi:hypothetical protein